MKRIHRTRKLALAWLIASSAHTVAQAQTQTPTPTSTQPLAIGITAPLTGQDAAYGQGLLHGARLAVTRANAAGGVAGRNLVLVELDDGGSPARAAANARELLARGVVALTGAHGSGSAAAVAGALASRPGGAPLAALVGPSTGAESLREPPRPGVFHLRAGVGAEASWAMLHLDTLSVSRYALVSQPDALGESGRERVTHELLRINKRPVANEQIAEGSSPADVQRIMNKVCAEKPEAVILATDASRAVAAMAAARSQPCATHYVVFSETGAALAARRLDGARENPMAGLLVTQVVPHPANALNPLVSEYQRAIHAHGVPAGNHPSLEAYLSVRVIQEALRSCGRDAGRACLLQALASRTFDIPGMKVQFGTEQRQPQPFIEITLLDREGRFRR